MEYQIRKKKLPKRIPESEHMEKLVMKIDQLKKKTRRNLAKIETQ